MIYSIRPFTPDDYEAVAQIGTAAFDHPIDPVQMRYNLEHSEPKYLHRWWVAEADGRPVAYAGYNQWEGQYHPRKFFIEIWVTPQYQRQGIGTALYETLMAALEPFEPLSVSSESRESLPDGMAFLTKRGFTEGLRAWQSTLELNAFDPTPYLDAEDRVRAQGIALRTYADLADDPERDQKLFDLISTVRVDMPTTEPLTPINYESWVARLHANPDFLPNSYMVAVHGDRYVGVSVLHASREKERLNTGLTAVRREYRKHGVAIAMKVWLLTRAKEAGYKRVITFNAAINRAMLGINERLGFVKTPAWIDYVKVLRSE
ncbi:MAG: N-acetyltransferase family protein [Mycobacterium leprae]